MMIDTETALEKLQLGDRFTYEQLLDRVQEQRQRPIRIAEIPELGRSEGICALWLMTEDYDVVLHARSESELHRQQFILHELAHMLLGHEFTDTGSAAGLLPDIPGSTVKKMLLRHHLNDEVEVAAESLADALASAIRRSGVEKSRWTEVFG